jgi:predicted ATP-dependent endonuclease of OLD family
MRILRLTAQNFMRIKAVEIVPIGNMVQIRGKNSNGKTSVLNAISVALGGKALCPPKPIRDGEKRADIMVDLGDYTVTRTFTEKDDYLTVKTKDGAKISNPQTLLDSLIGAISFDPLDFARMKPVEQAKQLANITGLNFDNLNKTREGVYRLRTEANRDAKRLAAQVSESEKSLSGLDEKDYSEELRVEDVTSELKAAQEQRAVYQRSVDVWNRAANDRNDTEEQIAHLEEQLRNLRGTLELQVGIVEKAQARADAQKANLPDIDAITEKFQSVAQHNEFVKAFRALADRKSELDEYNRAALNLTERIESIDREKAELVKKADLPVNHLAFDENGVYYRDVPFEQCSSSEQLKVSTALAMRLNPKLRVIRITDGSLLDEDSLATLQSIAESEDFQIWLEKVDDGEGGVGVVIEDGEVKSAV